MFDKFDTAAYSLIYLAQDEMRRLGHNFVGVEAIIAAILIWSEQQGNEKPKCLDGITLEKFREIMERHIGRGSGFTPVEMPFTPKCKMAMSAAASAHDIITVDVLAEFMVKEPNCIAQTILAECQ